MFSPSNFPSSIYSGKFDKIVSLSSLLASYVQDLKTKPILFLLFRKVKDNSLSSVFRVNG